jgi:hypothetical protein
LAALVLLARLLATALLLAGLLLAALLLLARLLLTAALLLAGTLLARILIGVAGICHAGSPPCNWSATPAALNNAQDTKRVHSGLDDRTAIER